MKKEKSVDTEMKVYNMIRQAIWTREIPPNSKLVEATIAEKFGVSRTPIRAALKKLSYEGLVTIIPRKGAFVTQPTIEEFMEVFSCRLLLERETARLAAKNITSNQIGRMKKLIENQINEHSSKNFEEFINHNNEMHMIVAEASHNSYYIKYVGEMLTKSNIFLIFYDRFYSTSIEESHALKEHKELIAALETRDANLCAETMYNHVKNTYKNLTMAIFESVTPIYNPDI